MDKKDDKLLNKALYICKFFAVISIVLAHTENSYSNISNEYIKVFLLIYKLVGVYVFLVLSGYFYNKEKYTNIYKLLKDKFIKLGLPWVVLGTLNYIIPIFFNSYQYSILGHFNFIIGNGSYLYFLTVLVMCYIIMYFVPKKVEYVFIILNILSIILTSMNVLPQRVDNSLMAFTYNNPYLNIFNWIGIFTFGMLIKRKDWLEKNISFLTKKRIYIYAIGLILYIFMVYIKLNVTYWNSLSILIGILSFIFILTLSLNLTKYKILIDIGKKSFFIYQIHLIFLIIFNNIFQLSNLFAIFRPIITVFTIYAMVLIGQKITEFFKIEKIYKILLGIR